MIIIMTINIQDDNQYPGLIIIFISFIHDYPLVICYIAIEHGPVEIVDLPMKNCDFPWLC